MNLDPGPTSASDWELISARAGEYRAGGWVEENGRPKGGRSAIHHGGN